MKEDRQLVNNLRGLPRPADHVWRLAEATVKAHIAGVSVEKILESIYPEDHVTPILARAASTQATLADATWAGPLARTAVSQSIGDLTALSVAGKLEAAGALRIDLGRNAAVVVPGAPIDASGAGTWVGEGGMIPVKQYNITGPTLRPTKLACMVALTNEIVEASNIVDLLRKLLAEAASLALDAAMFSTAAATSTKSAGLLNGLSPLTVASTGGASFDNCGEDLGTLTQDVASRGGGRNIFFVAAPAQNTSVKFFTGNQFENIVAGSAALAAKTVVALEPASLAFSLADPEFTVANAAAIHLEDTTPTSMGSPTKSMFQTDSLALKMTLRASWGMRAPHIAYMTGVNW